MRRNQVPGGANRRLSVHQRLEAQITSVCRKYKKDCKLPPVQPLMSRLQLVTDPEWRRSWLLRHGEDGGSRQNRKEKCKLVSHFHPFLYVPRFAFGFFSHLLSDAFPVSWDERHFRPTH